MMKTGTEAGGGGRKEEEERRKTGPASAPKEPLDCSPSTNNTVHPPVSQFGRSCQSVSGHFYSVRASGPPNSQRTAPIAFAIVYSTVVGFDSHDQLLLEDAVSTFDIVSEDPADASVGNVDVDMVLLQLLASPNKQTHLPYFCSFSNPQLSLTLGRRVHMQASMHSAPQLFWIVSFQPTMCIPKRK